MSYPFNADATARLNQLWKLLGERESSTITNDKKDLNDDRGIKLRQLALRIQADSKAVSPASDQAPDNA